MDLDELKRKRESLVRTKEELWANTNKTIGAIAMLDDLIQAEENPRLEVVQPSGKKAETVTVNPKKAEAR